MSLEESIAKVNRSCDNADVIIAEMAKKLTTKDRKKLPASVYCGPGRSFPVNDCKHAATAKTYLNRSNFSPAQKAKIAACINRRAKALGCPAGKPAKVKGAVEGFDVELQTLADSEIFKSTKELVESSIKNPGMELDFTGCEDCE